MVAVPEALPEGPLAEMVRRLVEALHPERIYLFGSQARGDATEETQAEGVVRFVLDRLPPEAQP